jgi:integrase
MSRFKGKVSLYTRTDGKYRLTDSRAFYAEGTVFILRYEKDRKRVWETLDAKDFASARRMALERELALASGAQPKPKPESAGNKAPENSLSIAIDKHIDSLYAEGEHKTKTIKSKQTILREFAAWAVVNAAGRGPDQIGRPDLMAWRDKLMKQGQSERTAINKRIHVVAFLRACGVRGILTKKDWRAMKLLQRRNTRRAYSKAEITALRKAATLDERDVIEFFGTTGMRKNQGVATRWTDIDFRDRVARVPEGVGTTEGKKPRAAKLGVELVARLEARKLRYPGTTYVFETRNGTPADHIDRLVRNAAARAGINLTDKSPLHSLRKTFATRLLNDGGYDMYKVSQLLGHCSIHTTELYASFDADGEHAGDDIEKILAAGVSL